MGGAGGKRGEERENVRFPAQTSKFRFEVVGRRLTGEFVVLILPVIVVQQQCLLAQGRRRRRRDILRRGIRRAVQHDASVVLARVGDVIAWNQKREIITRQRFRARVAKLPRDCAGPMRPDAPLNTASFIALLTC